MDDDYRIYNEKCFKALEQNTVQDEGSVLKDTNIDAIEEMSERTPFKFVFAPTPAPNDIIE